MLQITLKEKRYDDKSILKDISLSLAENGLYGVVGKNGVGKTTFFKCLSGIESFVGEILLRGEPLASSQVAFLPTEPYLYDHLTVAEFYTFYRRLLNLKERKEMPFEIDSKLLIKSLSSGMRKKVYFNAVLQKPYDVYIFDEPFSGLDIASVYQVKQLLVELSQSCIVWVASHILETLVTCKKIFLVENQSFQAFNADELETIEKRLFVPYFEK